MSEWLCICTTGRDSFFGGTLLKVGRTDVTTFFLPTFVRFQQFYSGSFRVSRARDFSIRFGDKTTKPLR